MAAWIFTLMTFIQSRKKLNLMKENANQQSREQRLKMHKNIFRTVTVVLTIFTITVFPTIICTKMSLLDASIISQCSPIESTITFFASIYIFICGRFVNVIIYNVSNEEFKKAFKKLVKDIKRSIYCARF